MFHPKSPSTLFPHALAPRDPPSRRTTHALPPVYLAAAWVLVSACGPVDVAPTGDEALESQAAPVAGGYTAELVAAFCTGTIARCADGTVSRCTLTEDTRLGTVSDGNFGVVCSGGKVAERHCVGGRLKKCTAATSGIMGWYLDPYPTTSGGPRQAHAVDATIAEFHTTGYVSKYVQNSSVLYDNGPSSTVGCLTNKTATLYETGFVQSCTAYGVRTFLGSMPPTGSRASLRCTQGALQSFHTDQGIASCTIDPTNGYDAPTAPTPFGMATCSKGTAAFPKVVSVHANGYLASCTLDTDFTVTTLTGRQFTCQRGKPLTLDEAGNFTSCALSAESTLPTQHGGDATCKAGSTIGFTPEGYLTGTCVLKNALSLPLVPVGTAVAANTTCAANTTVALTTDGYASRCTPTTNTVVGSARSGNVTCKANAQLTVFTSGAERGRLASCTPTTNTPVVREAAPSVATSCEANLPLTIHADGYLASCTLAMGSSAAVTGPNGIAMSCSGGGTLAFHTTGAVAACRIAEDETLPTEHYDNVACAATSALSFTSGGRVYGDCALTADAAVGFVRVGTAPAKLVTCKSGTTLVLTSAGYASTCTPTADLAVAKTPKSSVVLSCQADHEVNVATSATCVGCVLSCRVGGATNYTVQVEAIGEASGNWTLGAAPGTDLDLFDDGFVARVTPGSSNPDATYSMPTYHDPNSTLTESVNCKYNAAMTIQTGNRRLAMCTLGRAVATGAHSVDGRRRICPRLGVATFSTRGPIGDRYDVITTLDGVDAQVACPREPGETCASNEQCGPGGTCNMTTLVCDKVPTNGACTTNAQCVSNDCDVLGSNTCRP